MAPSDARPVVVKVGGSLYDVPRLGQRLSDWLERLAAQRVLLVPGGGVTADAIRSFDRWQGLGEEKAHWLALRSLTLNAHLLASLLPNASVVQHLADCSWGQTPILDAHAFCLQDEGQPGALPHRWEVTSDAIAARVATVLGGRLVLLKSTALPAGLSWEEAGRRGLVDACFAEVVRQHALAVEVVDLRQELGERGVLAPC